MTFFKELIYLQRILAIFEMPKAYKFLPDKIPVHLAYEILRKGDEVLANEFHQSTSIKPFCYGGKCRNNCYVMQFSTIDDKIAEVFMSGLDKTKGLWQTDPLLCLVDYFKLPSFAVEGNEMKVSTVSPVTLSKPVQKGNSLQKRYLELDKDPDLFCAELNRSLLKKADALGVNIAPVDFTNTFCKHAWVSLYGGKILGYRGDFTLKGDADSLLFALHAGIGERSSSGFGAIVPEGRR